MGLSLWVPAAYLAFLGGSLALFSKIYRKRQSNQPAAEPWFPQHKSRDVYISLLSLDPPPPQPILVAALLRRAMDDVRLIWSVRDAKAALTLLLQRGQIGDELWERFLNAEKELEAEIVEVVGEANTFAAGYGQQIFGLASEMVSHEKWKEVYEKIPAAREAEKARLAAGLTSLVLAPYTHLTPSSLTLTSSNPIPALPTPAPTSPPLTLAPLPTLPVAPPSRAATPAAESTAPVLAPAPAPAPATPVKAPVGPTSGTTTPSPSGSGASTPAVGGTPVLGSAKKGKKGSAKKKVKGGK